jgi:hypothetical protein
LQEIDLLIKILFVATSVKHFMNSKYLFIAAVLFTSKACVKPSGINNIDNFSALKGTWERTEGDSRFVESWKKINNSTYYAFSVEIQNGDTVFSEAVELIRKKDGVYYIVSFPGQNVEPVSFKMIANNPWTFENKANDFPQRIIYKPLKSDSLHAWIEGSIKGKEQRVDFKMKRSKP